MASQENTASHDTPLRRAVFILIQKLTMVKDAQIYVSRSFGKTGKKSGQHSKFCGAS